MHVSPCKSIQLYLHLIVDFVDPHGVVSSVVVNEYHVTQNAIENALKIMWQYHFTDDQLRLKFSIPYSILPTAASFKLV